MRLLAITLLVAISCATYANGFLFKKKFVDGCNPDPCKHKSACHLNPKDKADFTCKCTEEYHGKKCEIKSGCRKNPCGKHGTCTNDKLDQKKYNCKCEHGYVGKDCDTVDKCIKKNPCKSGSVCTLDKKLKPVCACKAGFKGKKCDKRNCTIERYKGSYITGKDKIYIDEELKPKFKKMDSLAKLCQVTVNVTRSFTKLVNPTDMPINNMAMFFIGRGIEFTILDKKGKTTICDKKCLSKTPIASKQAACFINGLDALQWKYSTYLPGVIHDGYHVANFKQYNELKVLKQVGCQQDKHFPVIVGRDHLVVDYGKGKGGKGVKKCPTGLAGPKCDKDDLCIKKNPCNKDSVCTLDEKLKPVCACPNGYTGKKCNKKNCTIKSWKGKRFGSGWFKTEIYISEDMVPNFKKFDELAKLCKIKFDPLSSFKKNNDKKSKIKEDAGQFIGYGIETELLDDKGKILCNKVCLKKNPNPLPQVKCFLEGLDAIKFKHNPKFPGIFYHTSLLTLTESQYRLLKELKQVGCSDEKFYKKL